MDGIDFDFHMKDIPVAPNNIYVTLLVSTILSVCTRVRWKLGHFKHPEWKNAKNNYGFSTPASPPQDKDLDAFEEMMLNIPSRIKFKDPRSAYQSKLKKNIQDINRTDKIIIMADKTRNNYLASPENYSKLLSDAITKDHKKAGQNIVNAIHIEASKIMDSLDISDRVDQFRLQD